MISAQNRAFDIVALNVNPEKVKCYLRLLAEAIRATSQNKGTLRKDIWTYLMKKFKDTVEYRDFLLCIRELEKLGKVSSKDSYFRIAQQVYEEIEQ